jgi:hypothetical protein
MYQQDRMHVVRLQQTVHAHSHRLFAGNYAELVLGCEPLAPGSR